MGELLYGAALYPEVWSEEVFQTDLLHMKKLGMNYCRIGEFMWEVLEPKEDHFCMEPLRYALERLEGAGIQVLLATPTAAPPRWLSFQHSDRLFQDREGRRTVHGSRQHLCINQPYFRERVVALLKEIGKIIGEFSHINAIQLDNEWKSHTSACFCPICQDKWRQWLKERYSRIENLNRSWQTAIWSQAYQSFAEIPAPESTAFLHNSALERSYLEYSQKTVLDFADLQITTLRSYTKLPITHNTGMGFSLNNQKLFEQLDFTSFDTYASAQNYPAFLINLDLWPQLKPGKPCRLLETALSHSGYLEKTSLPHPEGYVLAEAFATYAAGLDCFQIWPFRRLFGGCEQTHSGVVSSWGEPDIGYESAKELGNLRQRLEPLVKTSHVIHPDTALVYSDAAALFYQVETTDKMSYRSLITEYYSGLLALDISRELIPETADLSPYKILHTPYLRYLSESFLTKALDFVENGGIWLVGPQTADRSAEHTWQQQRGLGGLGEVLGINQVVEIPATDSDLWGEAFGETFGLWGDSTLFIPENQQDSLGQVSKGIGQGRSFLMEKNLGKGKIIYMGSGFFGKGGAALRAKIWSYAQSLACLTNPSSLSVTKGIYRIQRRSKNNKEQHWLVNMTASPKAFQLSRLGEEQLQNCEMTAGEYFLAPFSYKIIEMR